jgi:hypothetical protein
MPRPKRAFDKEESDMGKMLLGLAAAAAFISTPALADGFGGNTNGTNGFVVIGGGGDPRFGNHHGGHHGNGEIGTWVNGGEWALYNNRTFQSDSFNDWWHDRPDRAYPAWMRNNQDCQRQWYAGNTLRC